MSKKKEERKSTHNKFTSSPKLSTKRPIVIRRTQAQSDSRISTRTLENNPEDRKPFGFLWIHDFPTFNDCDCEYR